MNNTIWHNRVVQRIGDRVIDAGFNRFTAQWIIDYLEESMGYEYGALLTVAPESGRLLPVALSRQGQDGIFLARDSQYVEQKGPRRGQGLTGWVALTGQTALSDNVRRDSRYFELRNNIHSELCVPISAGHQTVGVINTESVRKDVYDESDARLLQRVAAVIGAASEVSPGPFGPDRTA